MQEDLLRKILGFSREEQVVLAEWQKLKKEERDIVHSRRLALVVEDDPLTKNNVRRLMENGGYAVMTASSGHACMNILKTVKPNIILLDIMLPDFNGDEIFSQIRQTPRTAFIPVVFISGEISVEEESNLKEMPLERYVSKPFDEMKLLSICNQLLENSRKLLQKSLAEKAAA